MAAGGAEKRKVKVDGGCLCSCCGSFSPQRALRLIMVMFQTKVLFSKVRFASKLS